MKKHTQKPGGGWDERGEGRWKTMEMMGVGFNTHELRGGSLGSCAAEECCWGWKAVSIDLVPAKDTQRNPSLGLLLPKVDLYCVLTMRRDGLLTYLPDVEVTK